MNFQVKTKVESKIQNESKNIKKTLKYIGGKIPTKIKHMTPILIKQHVYRDFKNHCNNTDRAILKLYKQRNHLVKVQKMAGNYIDMWKITFVAIIPAFEVLKALIIKNQGKTNMRFSKFRAQSFYKVGNLGIHYVINVRI